MKTSEIFDALLTSLKVGDTAATVASRRDEITKALNKASGPRMAAPTTS